MSPFPTARSVLAALLVCFGLAAVRPSGVATAVTPFAAHAALRTPAVERRLLSGRRGLLERAIRALALATLWHLLLHRLGGWILPLLAVLIALALLRALRRRRAT